MKKNLLLTILFIACFILAFALFASNLELKKTKNEITQIKSSVPQNKGTKLTFLFDTSKPYVSSTVAYQQVSGKVVKKENVENNNILLTIQNVGETFTVKLPAKLSTSAPFMAVKDFSSFKEGDMVQIGLQYIFPSQETELREFKIIGK